MERCRKTGDFWFTVRIVDHFEKRILGNKCGPVIISETYSSSTGQIPNLQSQHKSHRKKHWHLLFLTELRSQHSHLFVEPFLSRCQQNVMKIRKLRAVQTSRVLSAAAEWTRINRTFSICPCKLQLPERIRAILRRLFLACPEKCCTAIKYWLKLSSLVSASGLKYNFSPFSLLGYIWFENICCVWDPVGHASNPPALACLISLY